MKRQAITETMVDKKLTAPAKGNLVVFDKGLRGFGVRVTMAGIKAFILNYKFKGRERRFTIGRYPEWSATAARDEALRLLGEIRKGNDPLAEKKAVLAEHTIADLGKEFMEQHARWHKRPDSAANDRLTLKNHILPALGECRISAVTSQQVEALKNSIGKRPQGQKSRPYAANRVLSLLSAMFSFDMGKLKKCRCVGWKSRLDNPALGIPHFDEVQRDTPLDEEQLQALESALDNYREQDAADAIRLLILTGARSKEVINAEWSMFDLAQGRWKKPASMTKEGKEENVPLSESALLILRRMAATANGNRFLFPGRTGEKPRYSLDNCWWAVCRAAGLSTRYEIPGKRKNLVRWKNRYRVHDLRHTYATFLVNKGHSLEQIGALLGHKNPATTQRYAHHNDTALRAVTNDFGTMLTTMTQ
jgi:integrase